MLIPQTLPYPLIAIPDLHGQRAQLERLIARLEQLPEWNDCALVFLGDFVDRGTDISGTIDLVLELLARPARGSAVLGNHDLALTRAARLDDGPHSPYWVERYLNDYDHYATFECYLGRVPRYDPEHWTIEFEALKQAIPHSHRDFLSSLPWVVEATRHLFLHCGLSNELQATAEQQLVALREKRWCRGEMIPHPGTKTDTSWQPEYPVWIGADRKLTAHPLPFPGKTQVTGHVQVLRPDVNPTRIRLDTTGGHGRYPLTACLLLSAEANPEFISSR